MAEVDAARLEWLSRAAPDVVRSIALDAEQKFFLENAGPIAVLHAELAKVKAQVARLQASSRDPADEWLRVPEVVLRTGKPHRAVRRWIRDGYLKASRWGASREWHIRAVDLEAFLRGGENDA
jgi:hypothetical protein